MAQGARLSACVCTPAESSRRGRSGGRAIPGSDYQQERKGGCVPRGGSREHDVFTTISSQFFPVRAFAVVSDRRERGTLSLPHDGWAYMVSIPQGRARWTPPEGALLTRCPSTFRFPPFSCLC